MINGHHKNMKTSNEIYRVVHATNVAIICLVMHNIECSTGHNTQPDVVGPFFLYVNEDRQELYFTSMLAYSVHGAIWMTSNHQMKHLFQVTTFEADLSIEYH